MTYLVMVVADMSSQGDAPLDVFECELSHLTGTLHSKTESLTHMICGAEGIMTPLYCGGLCHCGAASMAVADIDLRMGGGVLACPRPVPCMLRVCVQDTQTPCHTSPESRHHNPHRPAQPHQGIHERQVRARDKQPRHTPFHNINL